MSFMFHPFPYADPKAVNQIATDDVIRQAFTAGAVNVAKRLRRILEQKTSQIVGIDGYPGTEFEVIRNIFGQYIQATWIPVSTVLLDTEKLESKILPYLPTDRTIDPVLLYGVRYTEGYEGLQDDTKVARLVERIQHGQKRRKELTIVYGPGALSAKLAESYDLKIWIDITPRQAALNFKYGKAINVGRTEALPFSETMRRNYYIDFENAVELRWNLIKKGGLDLYISADEPERMRMLPFSALRQVFDSVRRKPFRCRPVYLEGVWGGFWFTKLRNLPKEMKNCAWVFDMIPMEVSLAVDIDGKELEVPFFTFVQEQGRKLLGDRAYDMFGGYFPIRFNYDDTYHSNGNMSIQCHPDETYVKEVHKELGRQDESYYVCVTGQQACTYLGFKEDGSCKEFFQAARKAEQTGELIDYKRYVNAVPSIPGTQVMIPAGTIHASGRNQVVLEIGSLTIGSYTYKLYDYQRIDPQTGLPRPIHLNAGEKVIRPERTSEWVDKNLVNHGHVVRQGDTWQEKVVGEHDLLYFSLRNLIFEDSVEDDTKGTFHVLALVDGEKIRVESLEDPSEYYEAESLDILVIPASIGRYRIINKGIGIVTVHKTMLKENL